MGAVTEGTGKVLQFTTAIDAFELKDNCYVSDSMILFLEYRAIPGPKIGTWGTQLGTTSSLVGFRLGAPIR